MGKCKKKMLRKKVEKMSKDFPLNFHRIEVGNMYSS